MPNILEQFPFPLEGGALQSTYSKPLWPVAAPDWGTCAELEKASNPVQEIEHLRAEIRRLKAHVAKLEKLAHRDCLLGIPNRRCFSELLERAIVEFDTDGVSSAMLFVDLNRLKEINDTYGHRAGDEALIAVVRLLLKTTPTDGCVARLGGDEFGILLKHSTEQNACRTASDIGAAVNATALRFRGSTVPLGISIGVAIIKPGDNPNLVVERADKEMYRMKNQVSSRQHLSAMPLGCITQTSPLDRDLDLIGAASR